MAGGVRALSVAVRGLLPAEGVGITDLGFANEPELVVDYASMLFTPQEAVDLVKVLGPAIVDSGRRINLTFCESVGWPQAAAYVAAAEADPVAAQYWPSAPAARSPHSPPTVQCG